MRLSRLFWFFASILVGLTAGLVIGWYVRPAPMNEVSQAELRVDYRTDYVLMVAEAYELEPDLAAAGRRLAFLGSDSPLRMVQVALVQAGELGFDRRDLGLLARLAQAFMTAGGGLP